MKFLDYLKKHCCLFLAVLLAVATFVGSLFFLGTTKRPSTFYQVQKHDKGEYDVVIFELEFKNDDNGVGIPLDQIWINTGLDSAQAGMNKYSITFLACATMETSEYQYFQCDHGLENGEALTNAPKYYGSWVCMASDLTFTATSRKYIEMISNNAPKINEVVFLDKNGNKLGAKIASAGVLDSTGDDSDFINIATSKSNRLPLEVKNFKYTEQIALAEKLIDEQSTFDVANVSYYEDEDGVVKYSYAMRNRAKFTEAEFYVMESVNNIIQGGGDFMESTANPLGFIIISLGVRMFGANTFGLRFMPLLFAAATIVMVYLLFSKTFNKEGLALLCAALFCLGGIGFFFAVTGLVDSIFLFFAVTSVYFMVWFYKKGMNSRHKFKTGLPLLLSGLFFSLALAVRMQAVYLLIGLTVLFGLSMYRQLKAYDNRNKEIKAGTYFDKSVTLWSNKQDYKVKATASFMMYIGSFQILAFVVLIISYLMALGAYSSTYGTVNVIKIIYTNTKGLLRSSINITSAFNDGSYIYASPFIGWLIGYKSEALSSVKRLFINPVIIVTALTAFVYCTYFVINTLITKRKAANFNAYMSAVIRPYIILTAMFIPTFILQAVFKYASISCFLTASVFWFSYIALAYRILTLKGDKKLFSIKGIDVTLVKLICFIVLALAAVCFILALPAYLGIGVNPAIYKWMFIK